MTVQQIRVVLKQRGKELTRGGLYKHLKALKVKPAGVARPAIYPDDTAERVCKRLGLTVKLSKSRRARA